MKRIFIGVLFGLGWEALVTAGTIGGVAVSVEKTVSPAVIQVIEDKAAQMSSDPGPLQSQTVFRKQVRMDSGIVKFCLWYGWCPDAPNADGSKGTLERFGVWMPGKATWHYSEAFRPTVDGRSVIVSVPAQIKTWTEGASAFTEFSWDDPNVKTKFLCRLAGGDDRLFCKWVFEPAEKNASGAIVMTLNTVPGGFGKASGEILRDKILATARKEYSDQITKDNVEKSTVFDLETNARDEVKGRRTFKIMPSESTWLFVADRVLDPETNPESEGGGGLVFIPEELNSIIVPMTHSQFPIQIEAAPGVKTLRFALFSFFKQPNSIGLQQIRTRSGETLELLRKW
ncbi:MAG: hypothetical protein V2A65_05180 [Candidatus Omnitrophota bacterium]